MIRHFVFFLIFAFFAINAFAVGEVSLRGAKTAPKAVRVGYYFTDGFQEGSGDTPLYGYGYEYYQRVSRYTGWRYEYVYGTFDELYQKFINGDVDLMAGFTQSPERQQQMLFPGMPMGREVGQLVKKETNRELNENPLSIQGKRIGIMRGTLVDSLYLFLNRFKIQADVKIYDTKSERNAALENDSVDAVFVENIGTRYKEGVESFMQICNSAYFLAVSKKRHDLLRELNRGLGQLSLDYPTIMADLYNKYMRPGAATRVLTLAEKNWFDIHDTLKIAYLKNMAPFSDDRDLHDGAVLDSINFLTEESDRPVGIVYDIVPEIGRQLGIKTLALYFKGFDNYDDMISALTRGEVDLAFPIGENLFWAERKGIYESTPVVRSELSVIFKGNFDDLKFKTFAVNRNNGMMSYYVKDNFADAEIKYYDSIEECLEAVLKGEVNSTILGIHRSTHLLKNRKYRGLSAKLMNIADDKYFGIAYGNEALLKIVNRGLALLGMDYAQNLSYKFAETLYKPSIWDSFVEHAEVVSIFVFIVAVLIALIVINRYVRIKRQASRELAQNELLSMRLAVIRAISDLYHSVFLVYLNNNSFEIIHTLSFVEQAVKPLLNQADKALNATMDHLVFDKYKAVMREFNDISKWQERLAKQDSVSAEYEGPILGWNRVTILVARRDAKGIPTHVLYIFREINNQKKLELSLQEALAQAEQANKAKTYFLNNMSHDIRTPMNAIIGFTSLALSHVDERERLIDYLEKINTSSEHLLSLINDVLDMRRIESGKVKLIEKETNLPDLLNDIRSIVQTNAQRKKQNLTIEEVNVKNENFIVDKLRLNQVLLNLLSNAIKFTKEGGDISLRVFEKPCEKDGVAHYEFRVKDNGIGINPKFQDHIFEAFTREESSAVSGIQGTGLGMAITKNIVTMMGGNIQIISEEGKGAEFIVTLEFRTCDAVEKSDSESQVSTADFKGTKILLVEDNLLNQEIAMTLLSEVGFVVDLAENGLEALEKIKNSSADTYKLVLMDVQMPVMDGYEAARNIRKLENSEKSKIPIIAMTANAFEEDKNKALDAGMNGHLAKPIDVALLMETLKNVLDNKS